MTGAPGNREAMKQAVGATRAGIPLSIFEKLPLDLKFRARWEDKKEQVKATLPRNYYFCVVRCMKTQEEVLAFVQLNARIMGQRPHVARGQ